MFWYRWSLFQNLQKIASTGTPISAKRLVSRHFSDGLCIFSRAVGRLGQLDCYFYPKLNLGECDGSVDRESAKKIGQDGGDKMINKQAMEIANKNPEKEMN